jgi:hypothetical protein
MTVLDASTRLLHDYLPDHVKCGVIYLPRWSGHTWYLLETKLAQLQPLRYVCQLQFTVSRPFEPKKLLHRYHLGRQGCKWELLQQRVLLVLYSARVLS